MKFTSSSGNSFYEARVDKFFGHMAERSGGSLIKPDDITDIVDIMMAICYRETGPDFLQVGCRNMLSDWSLITRRRGLQNGKIAGPKPFAPPPIQDRVKLFALL